MLLREACTDPLWGCYVREVCLSKSCELSYDSNIPLLCLVLIGKMGWRIHCIVFVCEIPYMWWRYHHCWAVLPFALPALVPLQLFLSSCSATSAVLIIWHKPHALYILYFYLSPTAFFWCAEPFQYSTFIAVLGWFILRMESIWLYACNQLGVHAAFCLCLVPC